ncbi:UL29 major DNA-binding protein [Leporid alphaherpesvirus 4]|uniref:UL29 major DNA-binding protein n=1 Tax=Leporid alphaherpesvirus 4 TaxID=481315 RepID=J9QQS6_9ALPH|nr:UL29 major DNA-binding protein [Leporid alphaherpesvirus 4]AFR32471.1 UL29 major DNA-binding protein [Leporid alphaherpesvirus 4]
MLMTHGHVTMAREVRTRKRSHFVLIVYIIKTKCERFRVLTLLLIGTDCWPCPAVGVSWSGALDKKRRCRPREEYIPAAGSSHILVWAPTNISVVDSRQKGETFFHRAALGSAMDGKQKITTTVKVSPGPIGYVYARSVPSGGTEELALLSARSADTDTAIAPLIAGMTVESGFAVNIAAIVGSRTTGVGGTGVSLKLMPSHYSPSVYVFHGGRHLTPSSAAPNLTRLCDKARAAFGFSAFECRAGDASRQTTGEDLCARLGLDPERALLYLVVAEGFKEAVYINNTFLHMGGAGTVTIAGEEVHRIPIFPLQIFMPDFCRAISDPFNANHRAIGENFTYPRPFFNAKLAGLLFGAAVGPAAVALRARNVDAVARAAAHLAFDENHEGAALPVDITYTAFEAAGAKGGQQRGGVRECGGLERRLASVMAGDAALALESITSMAVYEEPPTDIDTWPMLSCQDSPASRAAAIGAYLARAAGLVGSMVFSSNSALHMTEVDDAGPADPKDLAKPSFYRFFLVPGTHIAANPQVDRDGRVMPGHEGRQMAPLVGGSQEFTCEHLAMLCGFSPDLLAKMLFYLERCDGGVILGRQELDIVKYVSDSAHSDVPCGLCSPETRHACAHTTLLRLRARHPKFNSAMRGAVGIFGIMNSAYSDCDVLGSYASFSSIKRTDVQETARAIMQETYRAAVDRVLAELENMHYVDQAVPTSLARLDSIITGRDALQTVVSNVKQVVDREVEQLMRALVEGRGFRFREALAEANHSMSLTLDPHACVPCPLLQMLGRRSNLAVYQDLALSQCHGVFAGQTVEGRNFRGQFQPVLRRRVLDLFNNGFLSSKTLTVALEDGACLSAPSLVAGQDAPAETEFEGDVSRVNLLFPKEMRIKSRVLFAGAGPGASESAKARVASLQSAYQKPEKRVDILLGPMGFLLKQFHSTLFPNGKPPGSDHPNPQWFWTALQRNQLPARLLSREDIDTIAFIKRFSVEYGACNYINLPPNNVSELAMYYMANQILRYCEHSTYFINTLTAIIAGSRRPPSAQAAAALAPRGGSELEAAALSVVRRPGDHPRAWTTMFASCNLMRPVMATRPMVVLGLSISKYHGMAGNDRVFQTGNWANLVGGKNACPLLVFDRARKFVLACPRAGFVCASTSVGSCSHESSLCEQLRGIIAEGGATVVSSVFAAAAKSLGARMPQMQIDDWLALLEDEYLSEEMMRLTVCATGRSGEWSIDAALDVAREAEAAVTRQVDAGETFDFGGFEEDNAAAPPASASRKRARGGGDVFGDAPVEKRGELTLDML